MTDEIKDTNQNEQAQGGSVVRETEKANQKLFTQDEVNEIIRKRLAKVKEKEARDLLPDDSNPDETAAKMADLSAQVDNYRTRAEKAEAALNEIHVREEKKALCEEYSLHPSLVSFLTGESTQERREQAERLASATRPKYPRLDTRDMSVMASSADFGQPHKPKGFYDD